MYIYIYKDLLMGKNQEMQFYKKQNFVTLYVTLSSLIT